MCIYYRWFYFNSAMRKIDFWCMFYKFVFYSSYKPYWIDTSQLDCFSSGFCLEVYEINWLLRNQNFFQGWSCLVITMSRITRCDLGDQVESPEQWSSWLFGNRLLLCIGKNQADESLFDSMYRRRLSGLQAE